MKVADLQVNGGDVVALGVKGAAVGEALNALLEAVLREEIPNDRAALYERLKEII